MLQFAVRARLEYVSERAAFFDGSMYYAFTQIACKAIWL